MSLHDSGPPEVGEIGLGLSLLEPRLAPGTRLCIGSSCVFPSLPPRKTVPFSLCTEMQKTLNGAIATLSSRCFLSVSSRRQISPRSVHSMASRSDNAATQVNVASKSEPRRQFLPEKVFGAGLPDDPSCNLDMSVRIFVGEAGSTCSSLQTLTWRMPTLMTLFPIQAIAWTVDIHLLLECNRAAPCLEIDHRNTKPSFTSPKEHSQRVSGENAREIRPKLCS